jgi:hypothetical protein
MQASHKKEISMLEYIWAVWKNCRLVGYIRAFSEWDALSKAKNSYGDYLFVERLKTAAASHT